MNVQIEGNLKPNTFWVSLFLKLDHVWLVFWLCCGQCCGLLIVGNSDFWNLEHKNLTHKSFHSFCNVWKWQLFLWFSTLIRGDWIWVQKWILLEDYTLTQNSPHLGWIWVKDWAYKLNFEGFMVKNFYDNHIWSHCTSK